LASRDARVLGLPATGALATVPSMRPPAEDDKDDVANDQEQDLLLVLKLSNRQMGTQAERQEIEALAEQLGEAVVAAGVGEYDGDELGGGECVLFFCGPDPERLLAVLRPLLKRSTWGRGAQFVRMVEDAAGELVPQRQPL
jgi:hypothetical protein